MQDYPTVRKQPADSVPYGTDIAQHKSYVWCAYTGETLVAVAATAKEARALYRRATMGGAYGHAPPQFLNSHPLHPGHITDADLEQMGIKGRGRVKS